MKKLLTFLFLLISVLASSQDTPPTGVNFKTLPTWSFKYYTPDSTVWMYKGATYGWKGLAGLKTPTFLTNITTPVIYGSTAANGDLIIEGTRNATKTTSYVNMQPNGGNVGIGTSSSRGIFDVAGTSSIYLSTYPDYNVVITGGDVIKTIRDNGNATPLYLQYNNNADIVLNYVSTGNVCIGTTTGLSKLTLNGGLHVGGDSDAGDNNLITDGTSLFTGISTFNEDLTANETFVSGFAGSGWKLDKGTDYSLTVDNLTVRKMMRVYELDINKINSVNGGIMVSVANGEAYSVTQNNIYNSWSSIPNPTFTSTGLEITEWINASGTSLADVYFDTSYEYTEVSGTIVTFTLTYHKISGAGTAHLIIRNEDSDVSNTTLSEGVNTINYTVTGAGNRGISACLTVGVGSFTVTSVSIKDDEDKIYFDEDESTAGTGNIIQFEANDYIRAQEWTGRGVDYYLGKVLRVFHSDILGYAHIGVDHISGTPWEGAELVQVGNSSEADRQNMIYITASDDNNPYIDMLSGVTDGDFAGHQKLRIGNLTGITDTTMGALSGYGLWSQNTYLNGKLVLPNAGITNEGTATSSVRIYAGKAYADRATAPFNVTQGGSLTATGIAELGTAGGNDPEATYTNNTAIKTCYIYESSRNDDLGSLYINSIGYQGGTTKYRNTYLGDGKNGYLFEAIGSKGTVSISKAFAFKPYEFFGNYNSTSIISSLYIHSYQNVTENDTLRLPDHDDITTQFGAGKSAMYPQITVINENATYNLVITTISEGDEFITNGSGAKYYTLAPAKSIIMTFTGGEGNWYVNRD